MALLERHLKKECRQLARKYHMSAEVYTFLSNDRLAEKLPFDQWCRYLEEIYSKAYPQCKGDYRFPTLALRIQLFAQGKLQNNVSSSSTGRESSEESFSHAEGIPSLSLYRLKGQAASRAVVSVSSFPSHEDQRANHLWSQSTWNKIVESSLTPEAKMIDLLKKQLPLKATNFKFVKGQEAFKVCDPFVPDFLLVKKGEEQEPTPLATGALLYTQSTSESQSVFAIGEAISAGHILLSNLSSTRRFIMVGLTNLKRIQWFAVRRDGEAEPYCRSEETANVKGSLCGFMCSTPEFLGMSLTSFKVGKTLYTCVRCLGEGGTSIVYATYHKGQECALKVAKAGHSVLSDRYYLEKLKGSKGIPEIVGNSNTKTALLISPACEKVSLDLLVSYKMQKSLGDLVDILKAAHGKHIVNRDVWLQNIMISIEGGAPCLFIVDWGYAADLGEKEIFAGTVSYASDRVLRQLQRQEASISFHASDDLVSLVRSLYAFQHHIRVPKALRKIDSDEYHKFRCFWKNEFHERVEWKAAEKLAKASEYSKLKDWIVHWAVNFL